MPTTDYKATLLTRLADSKYAAGYLNAAMAEGEDVFLLALRDIVEARGGMTWLAKTTGLNRVTLYRLLSGREDKVTSHNSVQPLNVICSPTWLDEREVSRARKKR